MTTATRSVASRAILAMIAFNTILLIGNGVFMLLAPQHWYFLVPGVKETGSYNQHFIRDIGIIQAFLGAAFSIGWFRAPLRLHLWAVATLWLIAHAFFHFWEVAVGICAPSALLRDFPAVTLPALLGVVATAWAWFSNPVTSRRPLIDGGRGGPHAAPAVQELRDAR
jgi:hypothetical protein